MNIKRDQLFFETSKLLNTFEKLLIYFKIYFFEIERNIFLLNLIYKNIEHSFFGYSVSMYLIYIYIYIYIWTPTYGRTKAGRPARTYIQQLCDDTGCSPEDLPEAVNYRER